MSIRKRIFLYVGVAYILILIALSNSLYSLYSAKNTFVSFVDHDQVEIMAYKDMHSLGMQIGQTLLNIVLNPKDEKLADKLKQMSEQFEKAHVLARSLAVTQEEIAMVNEIKTLRTKEGDIQKKMIDLASQDQWKAFAMFTGEDKPVWQEISDKLMKKIEDDKKIIDQNKIQAERGINRSLWTTAILALMAIVAGAALLIMLTSDLARRMKGIAKSLADLERDTNVGENLPESGSDEIGMISHSINGFIGKIRDAIVQVRDSTSSTMEIATRLDGLATKSSDATTNQTASVMNISSAMEEISASVKEVAHNAGGAAQVISDASHVVRSGVEYGREGVEALNRVHQIMNEASRSIKELDESLDKIDEVANGIREITEQTNLLALSASIEAARAGEKGRGFSVVAEEVRTLSIHTANFTQDIVKIIRSVKESAISAVESMRQTQDEVVKSASHGKKLEAELNRVEKAITTVKNAMEDIAFATGEQSRAVGEVASNLERVATVAEATGKDIVQTSEASKHLIGAAEDMLSLVSQFRLAFLSWSNEFSVGVPKFDNQHKELFRLINELHDAVVARKGRDTLASIFRGLLDYTTNHFAEEERAMAAANYSDLPYQKSEHTRFVEKVTDVYRKFNDGQADISMDALAFLVDWLKNHIAKTDKKYAPVLSKM